METLKNTPGIIKATFTVKRKEYITPHYIRITLTGDDLHLYSGVTVGANNKIFITGKEQAMIRRTYTLRGLDLDAGEMQIEFVAHGEEGPASAWAIHAKEGDLLEIAMKDKKSNLFPDADWYLLAGDHTALPVISVMLENLPAHATGFALIEVAGPEDIIAIKTSSKVAVRWIFSNELTNPLYNEVINVALPQTGSKFIFAAAESGIIKDLRVHFAQYSLQREEFSAYAYWKKGISEDGSQQERRGDRRN